MYNTIHPQLLKIKHTLHKKVKDICQYVDLHTKLKANTQNI